MILGVELAFGCFQWTSQCETEKHASEGGNHDAKIKEAKNKPARERPKTWELAKSNQTHSYYYYYLHLSKCLTINESGWESVPVNTILLLNPLY